MSRSRSHYSAERKAEIVRRHLGSRESVSDDEARELVTSLRSQED